MNVVGDVDLVLLEQDVRTALWDLLSKIPDARFKNGRTSTYWRLISNLEDSLQVIGRSVKLDLDKWDVAGKIFTVVSYEPRESSTAVKLGIKDDDNNIVQMVVPYHSIEWIN